MIHVNLLPYREAQRQRNLRTILVAWCVTVITGLAVIFVADSAILDEIQALKSTQARHRQTIEALDKKLGEIKDIKKRKELVLARLEIIHRLNHEKKIPVHILDELTKTIPEHVWLNRIKSKQDHLTLNGLAMSSAVVADFMQQLARSPYFSTVELSEVAQKSNQKGGKIKAFSLDLKFSRPKILPPPTSKAQAEPSKKTAQPTPIVSMPPDRVP